jgi:hypothetical protein
MAAGGIVFEGHNGGTRLMRSQLIIPSSIKDPCTNAHRRAKTARITSHLLFKMGKTKLRFFLHTLSGYEPPTRWPNQLYLLQFSLRTTDLRPPEGRQTRADSHSKKRVVIVM